MSDITNILAVETTGSVCSVALHTSNGVIEDTRNVARMHNHLLLGMIDDVVSQWGAHVSQLDAVAFGSGPGSFTGVRIGAATCQAIAYAADVGVACVSSSRALATTVAHSPGSPDSTEKGEHTPPLEGVITLIASVPGAAYLSAFTLCDGVLREIGSQSLVKQTPGLPDIINDQWRIAGVEWPWSGQAPCAYANSRVDAVVIAELGLEIYARGELVRPELALPVYVSGDHPWK